MSEPQDSQPNDTQKSRSERRRRRPGVVRRIWSEWRVELLVVGLVAIAIFLLVEQMQIRETVVRWLGRTLETVGEALTGFADGIAPFISRTTVSDLLGYALLLLAAGLVFLRIRWRLVTTPRFTELKCPECGSELSRVHRRWSDRVVNAFAPVRRYQCKNHDCYWQGRRYRKSDS